MSDDQEITEYVIKVTIPGPSGCFTPLLDDYLTQLAEEAYPGMVYSIAPARDNA